MRPRSILLVGLIGSVLAAWPGALRSQEPIDVQVAVSVNGTTVPLSVHTRFTDVATRLPDPVVLVAQDAHGGKHAAKTYCYAFAKAAGSIRIELFDSDFGMHTARLSRHAKLGPAECTALSSEPVFLIGAERLSLDSQPPDSLPGFTRTDREGSIDFKRTWSFEDPKRSHMWGTCFSRSVSVQVETRASLTVSNWEEPGC